MGMITYYPITVNCDILSQVKFNKIKDLQKAKIKNPLSELKGFSRSVPVAPLIKRHHECEVKFVGNTPPELGLTRCAKFCAKLGPFIDG